jgi:hypothetical protein
MATTLPLYPSSSVPGGKTTYSKRDHISGSHTLPLLGLGSERFLVSELGYFEGDGRQREGGHMRKLLAVAPLAALLTACEDAGNAGDDNLLTGGSLVLLVIVVVAVIYFVRRRRA